MEGKKVAVKFDVQEYLVKMLEYANDKYQLGDQSKALRCILDYVAIDADQEEVFKQIRCIRCGPDDRQNQEKHEAKQV